MRIGTSVYPIPDGEPDASVGIVLAAIETVNGPEVGITIRLDSPAFAFTFCVPPDVADNLAARLAVTLPEVAKECREFEEKRQDG